MKILIIDDSDIFRDSLSLLLRSEWPNAHIFEANDGKVGVDQAIDINPDLILLDGSMPHMNGDEAAARLRSLPQTEDIPIIALTSEVPETPLWKGLKNQCAHILPKPFHVPSFLQLVSQEVDHKREV